MSFYDDASLMMIPSGAKDDKLYSIKPTDGNGDFTFSRDGSGASKATRINSSGLIEKGHTNEILKSNNFGDGTWIQSQTTRTSGQDGYDGTTDAWEIVRASGGAMALQQTISVTGVLTFSIYVKINTINGIALNFGSLGASIFARFNISDDQQTSAATSSGLIASTQEYVGNDFYRISITANTAQTSVRLYTTSADGTSGVGTGGTYIIQDSQLQKGLVVTEYHETDSTPVGFGLLGDMPRLDYSDGASCPCVLMEPARENKVTNSEYSGGYPNTDCTLSDNEAISPEGVKNAMKMTIDNTETAADFRPMISVSLSVGKKYAFSFYAKADGFDKFQIDFSNSGFSDVNADYDLSGSGSVTAQGTDTISADILPNTNGWFRVFITGEAVGTTSDLIIRNINTQVGDGTKGILFYGFQFEEHPIATAEDANATSYIPTYGTAVSRAYDVTSELTYDDDLTSVVLFGEITMPDVVRESSNFAINMRKGSGSGNRLFVYRNNTTSKRRAVLYRQNNSSVNTYITEATTDRIKFAMQYNASNGSIKAFVNGTNVLASPVTDTDFVEFVKFQLSGQGGTMKVHQFAPLKATYTNDELATLTTI